MLEAFKKPTKLKALKILAGKSICDNLHMMNLDDFVNQHSKEFFTLLNIDLSLSLMQQHTPDKWDDLPEYCTARATVAALKAINNATERSVNWFQTIQRSLQEMKTSCSICCKW